MASVSVAATTRREADAQVCQVVRSWPGKPASGQYPARCAQEVVEDWRRRRAKTPPVSIQPLCSVEASTVLARRRGDSGTGLLPDNQETYGPLSFAYSSGQTEWQHRRNHFADGLAEFLVPSLREPPGSKILIGFRRCRLRGTNSTPLEIAS